MIDPIHSLAFSIQANRGIYAILLGSGVSRAAMVPTGWEITLDLIRKLAVLHEESCEPDPEIWYRNKFGKEPDYSELLDALAKTATERQQLLRVYWEPIAEKDENDERQPTIAHRALAAMVARGFIRIIITTNFDRLMETALRDEGIEPTVLSTPDQVIGSLPLIHTQCCVFKVHGDYLDSRIRNTNEELETYPPEFDRLLDQIFDEFGLIVCGWSADWDGALRQAILRAQSRRFTTYWTARSEPRGDAHRLIVHRKAEVVRIQDADSFFQEIWQNVEAIEEFSKPHPLSTQAAVANLKRYVSDDRFRIKLSDLIDGEVARIVETISTDEFSVQGISAPDSASLTARVRRYEAACSTLLAMATVGGYWAEKEHYNFWIRAMNGLYPSELGSGNVLWLELQRYPVTLLLYALGLGALEANRLQFLGKIFDTDVERKDRRSMSAVEVCLPTNMFTYGGQKLKLLEGMNDHYVPLNDWIFSALRDATRQVIVDDVRYELIFDKLEILMALSCASRRNSSDSGYWAPPGAFGYRYINKERILEEIRESLDENGDGSPYVESGIFGGNSDKCKTEISNLDKFIRNLSWSLW